MTYEQFISSIENFSQYAQDINQDTYFGFPIAPILEAESKLQRPNDSSVAYFSMEYGLAPSIYNAFGLNRPLSSKNQFSQHDVFSNYWLSDYVSKVKINKMLDIPIYSGGLGVLAGDTVKSIADMGISVCALGILWNKGYFKQNFGYKQGQVPEELSWDPNSYPGLIPLKNKIAIKTKSGVLHLRLWKYYVYGYDKKNVVPLVLLDSNLPENTDFFRQITDQLYRSDEVVWRIYQRSILGIGGMKAIVELGLNINTYHLNEGHAAFALVEKYVQLADKNTFNEERKKFVYTCHTPVAAGHDRFGIHDIEQIFDADYAEPMKKFGREKKDSHDVNLTHICLENCRRVNAVAQKHGEIMRLQFPEYAKRIDAVTNGVHVHTWVSESFSGLFDKYASTFGDWRRDPALLANVTKLAHDSAFRKDLFEAHQVNKRNLFNVLEPWKLEEDVLTISWARRITGYKRPSLIFHRINEVLDLAYKVGPLQIILAGKAHPNDNIGAAHIKEIMGHIDRLNKHYDVFKVLIIDNYDTYLGKLLSNSVDVWLNNPLPPFEASGTSGMKAILNGVVQVSTLDGWVVEAQKDDIGWIFGYEHHGSVIGSESELRLDDDSAALCKTLKNVMGMYYQMDRKGVIDLKSPWIDKMIHCIKRAAFFNTQRMVGEYHEHMWK
mgnify:CR=1 FL=1